MRTLFAAVMTVVLLTLGGLGGTAFQGHANAGQILADDGGSGAGD
jgi:hypothetical protein